MQKFEHEEMVYELWTDISLDADIPRELFAWRPPEGWTQWHPPRPGNAHLKPGIKAPTFALQSAEGKIIKLADYSGKVVWLNFWSAESPECLKQLPYLEEMYRKFKDKGLVVLGFNGVDHTTVSQKVIQRYALCFPNVVDHSEWAKEVLFKKYGGPPAPMSFMIDREGRIAAYWAGYHEGYQRGEQELAKLGIMPMVLP